MSLPKPTNDSDGNLTVDGAKKSRRRRVMRIDDGGFSFIDIDVTHICTRKDLELCHFHLNLILREHDVTEGVVSDASGKTKAHILR